MFCPDVALFFGGGGELCYFLAIKKKGLVKYIFLAFHMVIYLFLKRIFILVKLFFFTFFFIISNCNYSGFTVLTESRRCCIILFMFSFNFLRASIFCVMGHFWFLLCSVYLLVLLVLDSLKCVNILGFVSIPSDIGFSHQSYRDCHSFLILVEIFELFH